MFYTMRLPICWIHPRALAGGMEEVCGLPASLLTLRNSTIREGPFLHLKYPKSSELAFVNSEEGY